MLHIRQSVDEDEVTVLIDEIDQIEIANVLCHKVIVFSRLVDDPSHFSLPMMSSRKRLLVSLVKDYKLFCVNLL